MSPEFNYILTINTIDEAEAGSLQSLIERIRGVERITPLIRESGGLDNIDTSSIDLSIPIGSVIKAWRKHQGLTLQQLGEKAGLKKGYLSLLENNRVHMPTSKNLGSITSGLGLEPIDLLLRKMPGQNSDKKEIDSSIQVGQSPKPEDLVDLNERFFQRTFGETIRSWRKYNGLTLSK